MNKIDIGFKLLVIRALNQILYAVIYPGSGVANDVREGHADWQQDANHWVDLVNAEKTSE